MKHYDDHPLAACWPLMAESEIKEMADDIKKRGLEFPIVLLDGKILDGRNRYRACLDAKVEPRFEDYLGDDPLGFVRSRNDFRRHLTTSQRAMVAANLANWVAGKNQFSGGSANLHTLADSAEEMHVSRRSAAAAVKVKTDGIPELIEAVESGEVTVSAAATVADLPKKEQRKAVNSGKVAEKAKEVREKPRCQLCMRKGLFRDDCPECNDLREEKKKKKKPDPPPILLNPDADDPPEALWAGHPYKDLLNKLQSVQAAMTRAVRQVMPNGEVTASALKLRAYLTANLLLDYKPDAKETVKEPVFLPLRGVSKLVDLAGQVGDAIPDARIKKIYAEVCEGKPFIPFFHQRRREAKKARA